MSRSLFSPIWYKVATLKPGIYPHIQVKRHTYNKQAWYVYHDSLTGKNHRFNTLSHKMIMSMDGDTTVDQVWEKQNTELGDKAPTQDQIIKFIAQLFTTGILKADVTPDANSLFQLYSKQEKSKWKKRLWNPIATRVPLVDPENFLIKWQSSLRWIFTWQTFVLWLLVSLGALLLASTHWTELKSYNLENLIRPSNLILLWFIYPIIKIIHEFGHAFATKHFGGEVHEIGVLFLIFVPMPYVDASNAAAFPRRNQRIIVSAIGIMVELFLASLALIVWLQVEPGIIKDICFNIMVIASISTVLFNGNPLLKFDAYYVLADFLDIPNLSSRANEYIVYLIRIYGLGFIGISAEENPANSRYEKIWFVIYAIASFLYRMFIVFVIVLFISGQYFFIGIALSIWYLFTQIFVPLFKGLYNLYKGQKEIPKRNRVIVFTSIFSMFIFTIVFIMPFPYASVYEGVIWLDEDAYLRAKADGTVENILVPRHESVDLGQAVIESSDPFITSQVKYIEATLEQLRAQHQSKQLHDRVEVAILEGSIKSAQADLYRARENEKNLTINSSSSGKIIIPDRSDLSGRFVKKGELLAYVIGSQHTTIRTIIPHKDIGLLTRVKNVYVRLANQLDQPLDAKVGRIIPAAQSSLPSAVLGRLGGGSIDIDPNDPKGLKTLNTYYQVDISLLETDDNLFVGTRAFVKFDFGKKPLYKQIYRALRQLFLSHFNV